MPRLLIIKTSSLGDVVHNLPIVNDILTHQPDTVIDWVVEESFADIPALHPAVERVIPVAIRRWRKHLFQRATWQEIGAMRSQIKQASYDLILDTQGLLKSAVLGRLAEGVYHGQDRRSAREPLAACFYQQTHAVATGRHAVVRNRELAARAFGYAIPETAPEYGIRAAVATPSLAGGRPYIVGLHATSRDSKLWPIDRWIHLGRHLASQEYALLLPWGNAAEQLRAQQIAEAVPHAAVLPRLGLHELASTLAGSRAAIGVDTGLVHLAAALNVPTIALYTDTDPALTGIYPGAGGRAINLGGIADSPSTESVIRVASELLGT
jgi:heptosyltransferase-1